MNPRMDAAVPWTHRTRPQELGKPHKNAVSHSAHTHHRLTAPTHKNPDTPPLAPADEIDKFTTAQWTAVTEAIRRGDSTEKVNEALRAVRAKELQSKRSSR